MVVANSPALTVENLTVALVESGDASELSAMPIAQQLSSTTSFHVVPAHCSGRRRLHQSIIIFTCAASRCLESSVIVHRTHLHRSAILDLRFKMIIFTSCSIEPVRLHAACSFALCRARCLEQRLSNSSVSVVSAQRTRFGSSVPRSHRSHEYERVKQLLIIWTKTALSAAATKIFSNALVFARQDAGTSAVCGIKGTTKAAWYLYSPIQGLGTCRRDRWRWEPRRCGRTRTVI